MPDRGVVRAVLAADAERDDILDLVGDRRQAIDEARRVPEREIGADRGVAARDVEADADHRHLLAVRGHPADRHDVAQMAVRHEGGPLGTAGDVLELRERVRLVLAEDGDLVRRGHGCCPS